ncbi:MAG: UDP-4-amino-4,6-dideoxy-N-acetyl-beta-L-altrosamine transaminase [Candidatus Nealsonbacteria bacterium RIFOXYC1_FULL_40_7]|uniref:UDP-4-amino-4, 6-dideoxy-N-acetyl-beta-L-altrosamine transaminase n=1 Tax=Candidatus Nealsonbacteria bacterium RIFOXYC1_FULL_40_7 TaxID=1801678 RepID=A0A1G2ENE9_9BACT|nr:MAG: UDP-4-amino-4,6-dideoxy-N-acetyl-beta-L-altrosamine transaminase [Candidatus Nealsonbacteria bacterium RIFOXYC1_FULL_40_7]
MSNKFIPYGKQTIGTADVRAVVNALKADFLTTGPLVGKFENKFAKYVGAKYAVAVSNATAGLHLAVLSLEIPLGADGITSPITFMASSNAMLYAGLRPRFADIDPDTYSITANTIKEFITNDTRLIIPVHYAGHPCEMEKIANVARENRSYIIEDAAHAVGSKYADGSMVGSGKYSDLTVFSFHAVKTMTTGEGGMITTNNRKLYEKLLILRSHGIVRDEKKMTHNPGPWYHEMKLLGYNYRLTDFQAALGISQLKRITSFIKKRRSIVSFYNKKFHSTPWIKIPHEAKGVFSAYHLYSIQIDFLALGKTRREIMEYLFKHGIGTQVHYIPVHLQPYYREHFGYKVGDFPIAERYYKNCLSIPLFPSLTKKELALVVNHILKLCA